MNDKERLTALRADIGESKYKSIQIVSSGIKEAIKDLDGLCAKANEGLKRRRQ